MAEEALRPQGDNSIQSSTPRSPWSLVLRTIVSLGVSVALFYVLRWSVAFMRDRSAPQRLLVQLYTTLGMDGAALQLQADGLHPLVAKLLIMLVALAVGVLGVWALFTVANDLIDRLPSSLNRALRPLIFVGPAVALLGVYLVYPAFNTIYTSLSEDVLDIPEVVPEQYWASDRIVADYVADTDLDFRRYILNLDQIEIAQVATENQTLWLFARPATVENDGVEH
ncbi:MAG: hypothetical protein ACOC9Z_05285, partial [Chloroflexota bacterium]